MEARSRSAVVKEIDGPFAARVGAPISYRLVRRGAMGFSRANGDMSVSPLAYGAMALVLLRHVSDLAFTARFRLDEREVAELDERGWLTRRLEGGSK